MFRLMALAGGARLMQIQQALRRSIDGALSMQRLLVAPGQEWFRVSSQSLRSFATDSDLHIRFKTTRNAKLGEIPDINNAFGAMSLEGKKDADNDKAEAVAFEDEQEEEDKEDQNEEDDDATEADNENAKAVANEEEQEEVEDKEDRNEEDDDATDGTQGAGASPEPATEILRLSMICMRLNGSHQAELLVECLQKMEDVSVIVIIEASEVDISSVEELLGSQWSKKPFAVEDVADKKSVCFLKKELHEINLVGQHEAMIHLHIAKKEVDEKVYPMNVIVVNLQKNKHHFEQLAELWKPISNDGPAIAIGNFEEVPKYIQKKLGRVFFAFVKWQVLTHVQWDKDATDKTQKLWCTQNAFANGRCDLADFYNRKIDGINNTLLAVRYICYDGELMKGTQDTKKDGKAGSQGRNTPKKDTKEDNKSGSQGHNVPKKDEKLKNLDEVKLAYASAGQQRNSTRSKADRIEIIIEWVEKIRDEAHVIAVVETNKTRDRKLLTSVLGSDWQDDVGSFTTTNILCFRNKAVLGESANFRSHPGRFVSLEVPYAKDAHQKVLNVMIAHLPRAESSGDTASDVRDQALNDARIYWDHILSKGPAIAMGDFNLTPGEVHELFENGSAAFKTGQLRTNSKTYKRFTDNAYANRACELISFYCDKADGLEHKAFLVRYKLL